MQEEHNIFKDHPVLLAQHLMDAKENEEVKERVEEEMFGYLDILSMMNKRKITFQSITGTRYPKRFIDSADVCCVKTDEQAFIISNHNTHLVSKGF